ncbi:MAG: DUF6250 domain-containing protein [Paludibacter sp.]
MKKILHIIFVLNSLLVFSQKENAGKLLYSDYFNKDLSNWTAEFEIPETSGIKLIDSKLDLVSSRGATVWFKQKLSGNIMITYNETLIDAGGVNDRVSDMNAFWMANDPACPGSMIKRDGKFSSYDNLNLYYAGVGGHYNKFTRFRKYNSDGNKPVLKEYSDVAHLLVGNKKYSIKIIVNNGLIQYYLNDELYWELKDETPYKQGYFGFRTTISHQQFSNFKIYQL